MQKPLVVISRCINLDAVRFDGGIVDDRFAELLGRYVRYLPVCPEMEMGLGVPRDPIKLVRVDGDRRGHFAPKGSGKRAGEDSSRDVQGYTLVQPGTGRDLTSAAHEFIERFFASLGKVDGFLLKARSPSCGYSGTKIYSHPDGTGFIARRRGIFALAVVRRFPLLPVEDEERLRNGDIRHHFLVRLFSLHELRVLERSASAKGVLRKLSDFHAGHRSLVMAYSRRKLKELDMLVEGAEARKPRDVISRYAELFRRAFRRRAPRSSHAAVMTEIFEWIERAGMGLGRNERRRFENVLNDYTNEKVDIDAPLKLLRSYSDVIKSNDMVSNRYINPYPDRLLRFE
ncbi:MAG: hypothetical protein B6D63_05830 [Candidatus Latescibacteria bacterium 4484_7]|nr:MAG: hypothetical protein B6D63_05830 [Candidatus Latescibacteria bacterium 4484_7]